MTAFHAHPNYVSYEPENQLVFVRLDNGKIDLSVYLSNECDSGFEITQAILTWAEDSKSVIIAPHFSISSPVDYLVEGHGFEGKVDINAKPVFEAVRAEMVAEIARIDAIVYGPEVKGVEA